MLDRAARRRRRSGYFRRDRGCRQPACHPLYPKKRLMAIGFIAIAIATESVVLALVAQAHYYHPLYNHRLRNDWRLRDGNHHAVHSNHCGKTGGGGQCIARHEHMQKVSDSIGGILGPAMGGCVIAASGIASALWLHLALLLAAAFAATRLPKVVSTSRPCLFGSGAMDARSARRPTHKMACPHGTQLDLGPWSIWLSACFTHRRSP